MGGMLFLCATPIGNLSDISERVITTLREADLIACEDTRNSRKLFTHFAINTPFTSYHEYNKFEKAEELIGKMEAGAHIALVTDAGTPAISDPGEVLVRRCHEQGIPVTSLPGPCALITALSACGLPARRFCFEGFLPADKKERREILEALSSETRTIILYEAPHHLVKTLEALYTVLGDRRLSLCRELTKKHEEICLTSIKEALDAFETKEPRGEYVLVIEGKSLSEIKKKETEAFRSLSLKEHMALYEAQGLDQKECMKRVAKDLGVSKRDIYSALLSKEEP